MNVTWEGFNVEVKTPEIQEKIKNLILGRVNYNPRKRWTDAEEEKLANLVMEQATLEQMVAVLNRHAGSITARMGTPRFREKLNEKMRIGKEGTQSLIV